MASQIVQTVEALREEVIETRREVASLTEAVDELTVVIVNQLGIKLPTASEPVEVEGELDLITGKPVTKEQ